MSKKTTKSIRARRAQVKAQQQKQRRLYYAGAALAALVIIALFAIIRQSNTPTVADVILPDSLDVPAQADGKAWGPLDAPILIEEYADFQCPFCGQFATTAAHQLLEAYGDSGLVRFEFNHFAFLGYESQQAAEATECANDQGQFWPYHDVVFANQQGENGGGFNDLMLNTFAQSLDLDSDAFASCLRSNKHQQTVENSNNEAHAREVQSTPTLFINGEKYDGSLTFDQIEAVIEAELASS